MTKCAVCDKGIMFGSLIRHNHTGLWEKRASKNPRTYKPNLHKGKIMFGGRIQTVKACASCLAQYKVVYRPTIVTPAN